MDNVDLGSVGAALHAMQGTLRKWEAEEFGKVKKQVRDIRRLIENERSTTV